MVRLSALDLEPDIITMAKSLSGGYVPVGAIATRREIYQKDVFASRPLCRPLVDFGRNNMAMPRASRRCR